MVAEYAIMIKFSDANWDSPPAFGYLTVATITIPAILTAIMTLRMPQRGRDDQPQADPVQGHLQNLLSAMPFRLRPDGYLARLITP